MSVSQYRGSKRVSKTNTIINLNGKSYDAVTGKPIAGVSAKPAVRSIDGVVAPKNDAAHRAATKKSPAAVSRPAASATTKREHAKAPAAAVHHPHNSKTLMRHAVSKPSAKPGKLHAVGSTDLLAEQPAVALVEPKLSIAGIDKRREARARRVAHSKLISRFGSSDVTPAKITPAKSTAVSLPLVATAAQPIKSLSSTPIVGRPAAGAQKSMDIFQKALERANSHAQPAPPKTKAHATRRKRVRSHRLTNFSAAALAVLLIGGFLAYQNMTNVTLHMASSKAGFAAAMPGYKPSGFSVGNFAYSPGNVTINFHSNSDSRSFAVVEQPSNWDSDTLLNSYVSQHAQTYQTAQAAGRTIYLLGQQATWVNNGVWYQLNAHGLSNNQILSVAASM